MLTVPHVELIAYENKAVRTRHAQPTLFSGLLQCREYAHAIIADSPMRPDPDHVEVHLEVRMRRQARLDEGLEVELYGAEALLHNQYGPPGVLHRQLLHIRAALERPNVSFRVLPFEAMLVMLPIELYELPDVGDVAFSETSWTNIVYESEREVRQARRMLDHFAQATLTATESVALIDRRIRETS